MPRLGLSGDGALACLLNGPALFIILLIVAYPVVYAFWLSLHSYKLTRPNSFDFVGLQNYGTALADASFLNALRITAVFAIASVALIIAMGLAAALLLNESFRGRGLLRACIFVPWAIPPVVNGILWQWIFNGQYGALNGLLYSLGLIDSYRSWLLDSLTVLPALVLAHVWNHLPFATIVFLAALQAIPTELYDAAKVDRANVWQRFRGITLPWLQHPILIVLILQTMVALRVFDIIYVLTGGGPGAETTTIAWLTFQTTFAYFDFGRGSTFAYLIALCTLGLSLLYFKLLYARGDIRL